MLDGIFEESFCFGQLVFEDYVYIMLNNIFSKSEESLLLDVTFGVGSMVRSEKQTSIVIQWIYSFANFLIKEALLSMGKEVGKL